MNYISNSVKEFFEKLDKVEKILGDFSQEVDNKSQTLENILTDFENSSNLLCKNKYQITKSKNQVEQALVDTIESIGESVQLWNDKIKKSAKGKQFIKNHERYLVVMVFGAVKAGKSTLGNFCAGKNFIDSKIENEYKHRNKPVFATEEKGRDTGDIEVDENGRTWFAEGVIDTTGAIQYFTLSGLRWFDSPGTGALKKEDDIKNMEDMVNEYINYTDLCIFLQNSSEPGLQADMKYIAKLSKENQEAIVLITKSDLNDEDEDENGNIIDNWKPKSVENRKLQEEDVCKRIKEAYPNVSIDKYRAISISTHLANLGIQNNDSELYKGSNLPLFMKILGDKASDEAIKLKQDRPKKNINNFIDIVINGDESINGTEMLFKELNKILDCVTDYKTSIDSNVKRLTVNVCNKTKIAVQKQAKDWNNYVNKTGKEVTPDIINTTISAIISKIITEELNNAIGNVIENYEKRHIQALKVNIETDCIKKEYKTINHNYTETIIETRLPEGIWENIRHFFGKIYQRERHVNRTVSKKVDLGTNVDDFIEKIMPHIKDLASRNVLIELEKLRDVYFQPQENYVKEMQQKITKLNNNLECLKYKM